MLTAIACGTVTFATVAWLITTEPTWLRWLDKLGGGPVLDPDAPPPPDTASWGLPQNDGPWWRP